MEVDLLPAGELEQQVERTLEAVDVDDQRRLAVGALGELDVLERQRLCHHAHTDSLPGRSFGLSGDHRKRGVKPGAGIHRIERLGLVRDPRPAPRRPGAAASPASSGPPSATAAISSMTPLQCSTMSQPAAKAASRPLGERARQRLHGEVVAHHQAVIADMAADDRPASRSREVVAGCSGSSAV